MSVSPLDVAKKGLAAYRQVQSYRQFLKAYIAKSTCLLLDVVNLIYQYEERSSLPLALWRRRYNQNQDTILNVKIPRRVDLRCDDRHLVVVTCTKRIFYSKRIDQHRHIVVFDLNRPEFHLELPVTSFMRGRAVMNTFFCHAVDANGKHVKLYGLSGTSIMWWCRLYNLHTGKDVLDFDDGLLTDVYVSPLDASELIFINPMTICRKKLFVVEDRIIWSGRQPQLGSQKVSWSGREPQPGNQKVFWKREYQEAMAPTRIQVSISRKGLVLMMSRYDCLEFYIGVGPFQEFFRLTWLGDHVDCVECELVTTPIPWNDSVIVLLNDTPRQVEQLSEDDLDKWKQQHAKGETSVLRIFLPQENETTSSRKPLLGRRINVTKDPMFRMFSYEF